MSKVIDKTIEEIRELDPDLDDLSWREICYVVALEMGDVRTIGGWDEPWNKFFEKDSDVWPAYHESGEHAMRAIEALPDARKIDTHVRYNKWTVRCNAGPSNESECVFAQKCDDLKEAITKAAAKCVIEGIELEDPD